MKDRAVFMTDRTVRVIQEYLIVRGPGPTGHVFLYRNQPVCEDLIRSLLNAGGSRVGVKVNPHRLRHTAATQLLNAGCGVTSIQKLLGHASLNTTMVYARVHDRTVADDYYSAMEQVEGRVDLVGSHSIGQPSLGVTERGCLLQLAAQLAIPSLSNEARLELAAQMRKLLVGGDGHPLVLPTMLEIHAT